MTLRQVTIYNIVTYVSRHGHSHSAQASHFSKERDRKINTRMKNAFNNIFSRKDKKIIKIITREGFKINKRIFIYYF